ncbi:hypothetical protein AB688_15585 [Pseudomonas putida]|nr:hypothetical protein AB688_15585 [Pseudomonas putida]
MRFVHTMRRSGIVEQRGTEPCRALQQLSRAIGALSLQMLFSAAAAEGALERADQRVQGVGGQIGIATFAIGA